MLHWVPQIGLINISLKAQFVHLTKILQNSLLKLETIVTDAHCTQLLMKILFFQDINSYYCTASDLDHKLCSVV